MIGDLGSERAGSRRSEDCRETGKITQGAEEDLLSIGHISVDYIKLKYLDAGTKEQGPASIGGRGQSKA